MAIFKCKMCGGDLELSEGMTVAECEYCGSLQTVPSADNEKKMTLFSRANRLRAGCEFDKAAGVYETIVADFPEEAEAYWGLLLCRYGIEYVDDPATGKKIPTCHRSSFDSVMEDSDFEQACENADAYARRVYRDEAKAIEELRKGIIAVSANEQPYDIFICYKETADNGERTLDSVLAQDIYDALTDRGYRVFFSRVTLEDKLGVEYEPYIFAALNSAKLMLAVGTDYEHYNAVWVKNEWSRFLKLMAADKSKYLIPCFKGLDAYDMPREFAKLQAQDMGKVGAMQDLMRGIEKVMGKSEASSAPVAAPAPAANATVDSLLKRAFMFLEDGEWDNADEYCEKVLDIDPENAQAYLGKLMAEQKVRKQEKLANCAKSFNSSNNYKKALRFGEDTLRSTLKSYVAQISQRNEEIRKRNEEIRIRTAYTNAMELMDKATTEDSYLKAAECFAAISTYKDSASLAAKCREKVEEIKRQRLAAEEETRRMKAAAFYASLMKQQENCSDWSIAVGDDHIAALKTDGTVVATGDNKHGQCDVSEWNDIAAVAAGEEHTVGLKIDGTVVATGDNKYGQCDVSAWKDIVAVVADCHETIGLRMDGTVVATGYNKKAYNDIARWTGIAKIITAGDYTVGLKTDGTVVAAGANEYGRCNVAGWSNIVKVTTGWYHTVGLRANGTVIATGLDYGGRCQVSHWQDITAIDAGGYHTVGLRANGTVAAVGVNEFGQCKVSWRNIVALIAGPTYTVGLKTDGTVVATGGSQFAERTLPSWKGIVAIIDNGAHIVGLRANGTVVAGDFREGRGTIDIKDDGTSEGRVVKADEWDVAGWTDIVVPKAALRYWEEQEQKKLDKLKDEQKSLQRDLANLKGLFVGIRRKEIEERLAEIEKELKGLGDYEK